MKGINTNFNTQHTRPPSADAWARVSRSSDAFSRVGVRPVRARGEAKGGGRRTRTALPLPRKQGPYEFLQECDVIIVEDTRIRDCVCVCVGKGSLQVMLN